MPKLYEYLGLVVLFYANEHEPVHVHGEKPRAREQGGANFRGRRAGRCPVVEVRGKEPLTASELGNFRELVEHFGDDIARKWVDFFVFHKRIEAVRITRKIR